MRRGYVYTLHGKKESDVFYIGATMNPKNRESAHRTNYPYYLYDCHPTFSILEEVDEENLWRLNGLEGYWIQQFIAWGFNLVNYQLYYGFNVRKLIAEVQKD